MATPNFKFTAKQKAALAIFAVYTYMYIMLFGGSRSGKTFLIVHLIIVRALKAPGSRHVILRLHLVDVKTSIAMDTFPKVMELCFPKIDYTLNKSDWYVLFPNGSEIWFSGLDDAKRMEKILGKEYVTIYLNEVPQIPYSFVGRILTRLAQKVDQETEKGGKRRLPLKMYADCNPPAKTHWAYRLFVQKVDPKTRQPLKNAKRYAYFAMNPLDNKDNIAEEYITEVLENLTGDDRKRFLEGKFTEGIPNALWTDDLLDRCRIIPDGIKVKLPNMRRVVVAVDPSGAGENDETTHDEIGIIAAGLGYDGRGYILEDVTVLGGPNLWGRLAVECHDRNMGDAVVGEVNFGGAMVEYTIRTHKPHIKFISVTASRGKHLRAEPISALYEQDKVRHVGYFPDLEEEQTSFSNVGYQGEGSPNRTDAAVFALTELFPDVVGTRGHAGAMR